MDNLRVHKTDLSKQMYERLQITPIYNIPYSPETQPIESCFSTVKRYFNKKRLHCLVNNQTFDIEGTIREAFQTIEPHHMRNYARHCLKILEKLNFLT